MKILNKSLVAMVTGVLISPMAIAAIMDDDGDGPSASWFYSNEFLSTAVSSDQIGTGNVAVIIESEYAANDIIRISVTGGAVVSGFRNSINISCTDAAPGVPGRAEQSWTLLSADANGAVYRLASRGEATCVGPVTTVNTLLSFTDNPATGGIEGLTLNAQAVDAANTVTASFAAETNTGLPLDTGGGAARSVDLVVTGSQYAATVGTAFNGVVDVNQQRLQFVDGCCDFGEWFVNPFVSPAGVDNEIFAFVPASSQDISIAANFGWVQDSDEGTPAIEPFPGVFGSSCGGLAVTATELTATCNVFNNFLFVDVTNNGDAGNETPLPATTFVSTHVFTFIGIGGVESTITVTNINLGAWRLNGFQADIAYMPFQTGIGQVIYLVNRGSQSGDITVDWIDQNGNKGSFGIGTLPMMSTKAIGPLINQGLPSAQRQGGRLGLTITVNVPACDAQLNAQYNVSGDRAFSVARNNCPVQAEFPGFFE